MADNLCVHGGPLGEDAATSFINNALALLDSNKALLIFDVPFINNALAFLCNV